MRSRPLLLATLLNTGAAMACLAGNAHGKPAQPSQADPVPPRPPASPENQDAYVEGVGVPSTERPVRIELPEKPPAAVKPWRLAGTLGVVSLPRLISAEVLALRSRDADPRWHHYGFGIGFEYLPPGIASFGDKTTLSNLQLAADGRFFPWRFVFVGARLGYQFSRADSEKFNSEVDYVTTAFFLAPRAGILHTFPSGLTIGGELGATIPFGAETTLHSDATEDANARKVSKTFGMFVIPFVTAFRIGYAF